MADQILATTHLVALFTGLSKRVRLRQRHNRHCVDLKHAIERGDEDRVRVLLDDEDSARALLDAEPISQIRTNELLALGLQCSAGCCNRAITRLLLDRCPPGINSVPLNARDSEGRTPIMISIEEDRDEALTLMLIQFLGASKTISGKIGRNPINTPDNDGRNPIMQAIWRRRPALLQTLLDAPGIRVDAADKRNRNAFHHLAGERTAQSDGIQLRMFDILRRYRIDIDATDAYGRTCLHYAARWGHHGLVQRLLKSGVMSSQAVNISDERQMTPLHLAAEGGRLETIKLLLDCGADINAIAEGGWTPLHIACEARTSLDTIKFLIRRVEMTPPHDLHAYLERQTWSGKTALHVAAENGNASIIRYLLLIQRIKLSKRNPFGNSGLFHAARVHYKDRQTRKKILEMFAPYGPFRDLDPDAEKAAKAFKATIVDFEIRPKSMKAATVGGTKANISPSDGVRQTSQAKADLSQPNVIDEHAPDDQPTWNTSIKRHRIYDLLYGRDKDYPTNPRISCLRRKWWKEGQEYREVKGFRWIHLPANNVSWCRDLIAKHFIESTLQDKHVHGPSDLSKSFLHYERRGRKLHSRYMHAVCETVMDFQRSGDAVIRSDTSDHFEPPKQTLVRHQRPKPHLDLVTHMDQIFSDLHDSPESTDRPSRAARAVGKSSTDRAFRHDQAVQNDNAPSSMYLFMPYLHYETFQDLVCMQAALEEIEKSDLLWPEPLVSKFTKNKGKHPNETLYAAHLKPQNPSLHIRRTLDQFFYQNVDTHYRDFDQVIQRFQILSAQNSGPKSIPKSKQKSTTKPTKVFPKGDQKLIMVDQLWMWCLGEDLIVTAFPPQWEQMTSQKDRLNVLEGIIDSIDSSDSSQVHNVYELAMTIVGHCYGTLDRHDLGSLELQFLDKYKISLGSAVAQESLLFRQFWDIVSDTTNIKLERAYSKDSGENKEKSLPPDLLDIKKETGLLTEVKDILDELEILSTVFTQQLEILGGMKRSFTSIKKQAPASFPSAQKIAESFRNHERLIRQPADEITRMQEQAKQVQKGILALLDLKQKHANATEAHSTARQGQTIMVFTIVTVFFLPLSFMAAFFAIQMSGLSRHGSSGLTIGWVSTWMFSIGLPVALICVVIALYVERIGNAYKILRYRIKQDERNRVVFQQALCGEEDDAPQAQNRETRRNNLRRRHASSKPSDEESGISLDHLPS